jgi:hypothetical protein
VAIQRFNLKGILDFHVPPRTSRLKAAPRKDDLISVSLTVGGNLIALKVDVHAETRRYNLPANWSTAKIHANST